MPLPGSPDFLFRKKSLYAESVSIAEITQKTGTPVYIYSANAIRSAYLELEKGLAEIPHLTCYAVKSCSNLAVLSLLSKEGAGMDIVSGGELKRALKAGAQASKIVYSGVGKTAAEIELAILSGILAFNVESLEELRAIQAVARKTHSQPKVAIRFNPNVDPKTHPYISTGLKENKFGVDRKSLRQALKSDLSPLKLVGISIHIGSQVMSLGPLSEAYTEVKSTLDEAEKILGRRLEFVDLGGGFAISYQGEKPPSIQSYCNLIRRHFPTRFFKERPGFKILIEPGRVISGNSGILATQVLLKKRQGRKAFLVVDAAMNDLIRPALYGSHHEIIPALQSSSTKKESMDIVGPVCESADCFASKRKLPSSVQEGDLLAILSAGAYGFSMSSQYNSRPRPAEVLVDRDQWRVVRAREDFEDLVRGEST